jgi:hypothetical protein
MLRKEAVRAEKISLHTKRHAGMVQMLDLE